MMGIPELRGRIVECASYTPPLHTGERYIVIEEIDDRQGKMLVVRSRDGGGRIPGEYWAWRFRGPITVLDDPR